jgi:Kdo2-lipid IVA lauroyltransferase/acyltransferase
VHELRDAQPTVIFAPHFVGMDAGWTALTLQVPRAFTTIYTDQSDKVVDAWILRGRQRFGTGRLFGRADGVKTIVSTLREGSPLYLLPDMNFGPEESVFVPFYGVPAATVPSLSRFARLGRAKVVPVVTRMTRGGYEVEVKPAWDGFPSDDAVADTASMNKRLQEYIDSMPAQYYWVHKRFKSRPQGMPAVY